MSETISPNRRFSRLTQKDLARRLEVSYITVQRALNNSGYVSKPLKQRILDYARQVGYTPHRAAQALVRKETYHIALFSSDHPQYFWNEVEKGALLAEEQIAPFNYSVSYHTVPHGDTQAYCNELSRVKRKGLDAVGIVHQAQYDMPAILDWIRGNGIPFVLFNVESPLDNGLCYVGCNYVEGGALAAEFLAKTCRGSGRVGIISHGAENSIVDSLRQRGFLEHLREKCPALDVGMLYLNDTMDVETIRTAVESFLTSHAGGYQGLYFAAAEHEILVHVIEQLDLQRKVIVVCHDLYPRMEEYLESEVVSAVIYQNPILQGYFTVRVLESYLESGRAPKGGRVYVNNSIVMNANKHVYRDHFIPPLFDVEKVE